MDQRKGKDQEGDDWPKLKKTEAQAAEERRAETERREKELRERKAMEEESRRRRQKAEEEEKEREKEKEKEKEKEEKERYERELLAQHGRRRSLARSPVQHELVEAGVQLGGVAQPAGAVAGRMEVETQEGSGGQVTQGGRKRDRERSGEERDSPTGRVQKRTRSLEDRRSESRSEDPAEAMAEALGQLTVGIEKLRGGKTVPKAVWSIFVDAASMIRDAAGELQEENRYLKGKLEGRKEVLDAMAGMKERIVAEVLGAVRMAGGVSAGSVVSGDRPTGGVRSFAEATRIRLPSKERVLDLQGRGGPRKVPDVKTVLVRQEGKKSEEVRKVLVEKISPKQVGVNVKRVASIRNGVAIEVESEQEAEGLAAKIKEREAGFEVVLPRKRRPIVMVYDVRKGMTDEEVLDEIWERNLKDEVTREKLAAGFKIRTRKREGNVEHLVVECSGEVRHVLKEMGRIYIEWSSCRVKDFVDFPRCFKCQRFGHIARHCKHPEVCPRCAKEHALKDCKDERGRRCVNCKREGREDVEHDSRDSCCPVYRRAEMRYFQQIDYGF